MSLADKITQAGHTKYTFQPTGWGFDIFLRPMSVKERAEFHGQMSAAQDAKDNYFVADTVSTYLVEEDGNRCFPSGEPLYEKETPAIESIFSEIIRLNYAVAQETAKKN